MYEISRKTLFTSSVTPKEIKQLHVVLTMSAMMILAAVLNKEIMELSKSVALISFAFPLAEIVRNFVSGHLVCDLTMCQVLGSGISMAPNLSPSVRIFHCGLCINCSPSCRCGCITAPSTCCGRDAGRQPRGPLQDGTIRGLTQFHGRPQPKHFPGRHLGDESTRDVLLELTTPGGRSRATPLTTVPQRWRLVRPVRPSRNSEPSPPLSREECAPAADGRRWGRHGGRRRTD